MLVHKGNHIGDSWYFVENDTVHCYYLTCPESVERHTAWDIAHAVSSDLVHWELCGTVLERGKPTDWDRTCLATGSVLRWKDRYWMAYTALWNEPAVAVGIAVSDNLYDWRKLPGNPATRPDARYYEKTGSGARKFTHWRDPFLFEDDGFVYHVVCASGNTGLADRRGALGVARTKDMSSWEVLPPIPVEQVTQELECPQVRRIGNRWFLVFSSLPEVFSNTPREKHGKSLRLSTYCMVADSPFGPFRMTSYEPIVPAKWPVQPYACQLLEYKTRPCLMGTVWNDQADFVCDPIALEVWNDPPGLRAV